MIIRRTFLAILLFALPICSTKADSSFPDEPVFGEVKPPAGQNILGAISVGVRITAPSLHLRERVKLEKLPLPSYPVAMYNSGIVGKCEVLFDLKEDGSVAHVRIGRSPNKEFGDAAIVVVEKWKLEPIKQISDPKIIAATATFTFSIYSD